jgi:hypothetical protein
MNHSNAEKIAIDQLTEILGKLNNLIITKQNLSTGPSVYEKLQINVSEIINTLGFIHVNLSLSLDSKDPDMYIVIAVKKLLSLRTIANYLSKPTANRVFLAVVGNQDKVHTLIRNTEDLIEFLYRTGIKRDLKLDS